MKKSTNILIATCIAFLSFTLSSLAATNNNSAEAAEIEKIKAAAERGEPHSQFSLAHLYFSGYEKIIKQDYKEGIFWLKKSVSAGHSDAKDYMQDFTAGSMIPEPYETLEALEKDVKKGDTNAQVILSQMYSRGMGVKRDQKKAVDLAKKSATKGNAYAQFLLASYYRINENRTEALKYYERAANQDFKKALYAIPVLYSERYFPKKQDFTKMIVDWGDKILNQEEIFANESERNAYINALYNLGMAYYNAKDAKKYKEKGLTILKKVKSMGRDVPVLDGTN